MTDWDKLGAVPPKNLTDARLTLHWAAQLVAAATSTLIPKRPDDSHTALECILDRSLLTSAPTDTPTRLRVALSLLDLRIVLLDKTLAEANAFALQGKTLADGLEWLNGQFETKLALLDYEMPPHAIGDGGAFPDAIPEEFGEIARWFRNTAMILEGMDELDVQCWPHHFDLAVLNTLDDNKTIGVGLSPGDNHYAEPYWYVTPYPHPTTSDRPSLPSGHWHNEGFIAAILLGTDIVAAGDADAQERAVETFLEASIAGSRQLLSGG